MNALLRQAQATSLKSESSGLLGFWSRMSHLLTICGSSPSNDSGY
jgi:hypothetical protein